MNYDISIVGCGPVGATLANLLGNFGYSVAIFEKRMDIYRAPRAVHIDDEVLRIFQDVGILEAIKDIVVPFEKIQLVSAKRKVVMESGGFSDHQPFGHAPANWFLQPVLEEKLRARFQKNQKIHFYKGFEIKEIINGPESVQFKAIELSSKNEVSAKAKYLIGCDGGNSFVRKNMDVFFDSLNFDQDWMVIDTFVKSPEDVDLLPSFHQQICDPYRPITYVPGVGNHRRFEFMLRSDETAASISEPQNILTLISEFIDPDKLEIARSAVYTFHGLALNQWKKGRLILAGDSAHLMPPFAGQGMCSGIRDAHNLAFKLDLVLKGMASDKLLESYQEERKPHVTAISKKAINMGKMIQTQNKWKAHLRDFKLFLARNFSFLRKKIEADFAKKEPYKKGLWGNKHALSGTLAIQPKIQLPNGSEVLLDEILGHQFALISQQKLPIHQKEYFKKMTNGKVLFLEKEFSSILFSNWMQIHKIDFLIIRPDRYIYAAGKTTTLDKVLQTMNQLFK